jgi:MFS family permease
MGFTSRPEWSLGVLFLVNVLSFVDRASFVQLLVVLERDVHLSPTQVGLLGGTAFALLYGIGALPFAFFFDYFPSIRRPTAIFFACLLWSAFVAVCSIGQFFSMFVARMMVGLGEAILAPAAFALLFDLFRETHRARAYSVYVMGPFIGE